MTIFAENIKNSGFSRTVFILLMLVFISFASVIWFYAGGAKTSYIIDPEVMTLSYIDDAPKGGNTVGSVYVNEKNQIVLECELKNAYVWPFCEVAIQLNESITDGVDFTNYHSMVIDAEYDAPDKNNRLRVYLRNYDDAYSTVDDPVSMKFNGVEYNEIDFENKALLPLNSFQVLSWWISDLNVPVQHAGPDMTNITLIEIATSSAPVMGDHKLVINDIRFEGLLLTDAMLFRMLTIMWLTTGLLILMAKYFQSRLFYQAERRRAERLKSINESLKERSETLSILAETDLLTGLRNRVGINQELDRIAQSQSPAQCTVLCIDVDHFKRINDNFGHDMGDKILVQVARILRNCAAEGDIVARWGGEEFLIFCPHRNLAQASSLAEDIRSQFEQSTWAHENMVTCSIGVAALRENSMASMIANADDAMYQAKQAGRNRVEVFSNPLAI